MAAPDPKLNSSRAVASEQRRALLERVLRSRAIEKSARIRDFLAYVCQRAIEQPGVEIHEQEIGQRVFLRPADYDTAADNVVRVTASQARKKLEQYFSSEGAAEPFTLEIPKGGYTPLFSERATPAAAAKPRRTALLIAVSAVAVLALGFSAWAGWKLWNAPRPVATELDASPALNSLWSQLLSAGSRTDIVVMDSSLSLFQELHPRELTLAEYLQPGVWTRGDRLGSNAELQALVRRMTARRLTSLGSVTTAVRVAQLAGNPTRVSVLSARDFNLRQMKSDHVVLLGSIIANPWVSLIADKLNFRFGYDRGTRFAYFENLAPHAGEPRFYRTDSDVSFCHIAFLPNLTRTGNILAICGAEVEGTEGGGEFVTSERTLAELRTLAQLPPSARMPYFEVLLKSNKLGGSTPGFTPVAFRRLHP
jgi:hypothetical protein